jgi:hypothetical protein
LISCIVICSLFIGQRGNKDDAHELMKRARLIENKNFECKASQRSKEILMQLTQCIEEADRISRDAAGMCILNSCIFPF